MSTIIILVALFSACVIVGTFTIIKAIRTYNHNKVLFNMRALRAELISDLSIRYLTGNNLAKQETNAVLLYIQSLDSFCMNYNGAKNFFKSVLNFKYIITFYTHHLESTAVADVGVKDDGYSVYSITIDAPSVHFINYTKLYDKTIYDAFITLIPLLNLRSFMPFIKFRVGFFIYEMAAAFQSIVGKVSMKNLLNKFKVVEDNYNRLNNGGPAHA